MVRPDGGAAPGSIAWDPQTGSIDLAALEGVGADVYLAGESLASRRTAERKRRILESRVKGTCLVAESGRGARNETLGPRLRLGGRRLRAARFGTSRREGRVRHGLPRGGRSRMGGGCRPRARRRHPRRHTRFGVILSEKGDALAKMLTPFQFGVAGKGSAPASST
jgi:hypothetical protein